MKKHIKVTPNKSSLAFTPISTPVNPKEYKVDNSQRYEQIKKSLDVAIESSQLSRGFALSLFGEEPDVHLFSIKKDADNPQRIALDRLDNQNVKLLSVHEIDGVPTANVAVKKSKLKAFEKLLENYKDKTTPKGNPKNQALFESISKIECTDVHHLWFGSSIPDMDEVRSYELWFDISEHREDDSFDAFSTKLAYQCIALGISLRDSTLRFKNRLIKIVDTSLSQIACLHQSLGAIVEIRRATTVCNDFLNLSRCEQVDWQNSVNFTQSPNPVNICIIDRGINTGHPLLSSVVSGSPQVSYDPSWTTGDTHGHGTWMAGVAMYGDLKLTLQSQNYEVPGFLESAKIVENGVANDPLLYGDILEHVTYGIETIAPIDRRVYTLATTADYDLMGAPSSWSASVDQLAAPHPDDDTARLFVISAGNAMLSGEKDIPTTNINASVQDPANAYNALTIGYWASEANLNETGYELYSELTDIGPSSTTSVTWRSDSPLKPEVVFEGGNFGYDPTFKLSSIFDDLSLLTTSHNFLGSDQFIGFGETSAATAMASNFSAKLWAQYPDYWPETIRALIVHSATWPEKISARFGPLNSKTAVKNLLRFAGYGHPNFERACYSGNQSVNLVVQDVIQPYTTDGTMNEMLLYNLPWPENELMKLEGQEVKLKVTLSYFIEPNPGEGGWSSKFKYCSHGLRFDFNAPGENSDEFSFRINKKFRATRPDVAKTDSDSSQWLLGQRLRSKGSIHSDTWTGTARELAEKKHIAVYPVSGWWKELKSENRQSSVARFSLIISIETPENNLDIHNEIENLIAIENTVQSAVLIEN
ncbi:S8 family peptidase [Aliivibrio logei]|uniref:S8 family peptidase n=1 Tax=Aliivibrio logei TaxID=688 RepID=UPI0035C89C66